MSLDLLDLDDDEFMKAVAVACESAEDWQRMLDPAIVERTVFALSELQVTEQQGRSRLHEFLASGAIRTSREATEIKRSLAKSGARERVIRLRKGQALKTLRDVNREENAAALAEKEWKLGRRRDDHAAQMEQRAKLHRDALRRLTLAIQAHRLAAVDSDLSPEPADRELWAVLDDVRVPIGDGEITLTEMLGRGSWAVSR